MTRLMSSRHNTPATIFVGLFDFIDDQDAFVNTFGCNSPPLFLSTTQHGLKENSFLVTGKIDTFSMCQLFIFCVFVDNEYAGTYNYDSRAIFARYRKVLSRPRMNLKLRNNKHIYFVPDDLFNRYLEYTTMLSKIG